MDRKHFLLAGAAIPLLARCHSDPYITGTEPPWSRKQLPAGQITEGNDWAFYWTPLAGKYDLHASATVNYKGAQIGSVLLHIGLDRSGAVTVETITLEAIDANGVTHGPQTFDVLNNPWSKGKIENFFERWFWHFDGVTGTLYNGNDVVGTSVLDQNNLVTHQNHTFQGGLISWDTAWPNPSLGPNVSMECVAALAAECAACAQLLIDVALYVRLGPLAGPLMAQRIAADAAFVVSSALAANSICNK